MKIRLGTMGTGFVVTLVACGWLTMLPSAGQAAPAPANYKKFCRKCHGDNGSGNGPAAAVLDKHPGNFTDCATMKTRTHDYLTKIISKGGGAVGKSPQMPSHAKKLSAEEIEELATYVATHFCGGQ
ncbi:MAG: c-type cytochrome [Candidatus Binatia bacterium]